MPRRIEFTPAAAREFRKLSAELQKRIGRRIDKLATDPRPDAVKKLSDGSYRILIGAYRVLYQVHDAQLLIIVIRVRNRKDAYGT
ncbi:MAG: type II toxin-antitoxin system RelE family toxin [Candidatus Binatia bacterium]